MARITSDTELQDEIGKLAGQPLPAVDPVLQVVGEGEDIAKGTGKLARLDGPQAATASITGEERIPRILRRPGGFIFPGPSVGDGGGSIVVDSPTEPGSDIGQVDATAKTTPGVEDLGGAKAAQLVPGEPYVNMTGVEGTVSEGGLATAATETLDPKATVQYQLGEIMSSLESGGPMPAFAAPAVRKVNAVMQARGLGASSMAAAAITQALMESGVQIAAADANKYAAIQLQNLGNRQQTALANAAAIAGMDKANLSARLQGAVTNGQSILSVDLKNLDNKQKSDTLTYSALTQALFKDAAEENARQQFNAKNQLQVDEFFAELGSQVETANANRVAAMRQFNTSEKNAMAQFNQQVTDSRDKFNANMQYAIDQSNTVWRREINTANTALQNESNRINVQNAYNATQTAMNQLWQQYRDNASWNFQKSENTLQREHDIGTLAMQFANSKEMYSQEQKDKLASGIGSWIARWGASS